MAGRRKTTDVDDQIDLHGINAEQLRLALQQRWPQWRSLRAVRIVHGQGTVLKPEIERWCAEMGIPYLPDTHNPGAVRIFPLQRSLPNLSLGNSLRDKGLRLTPEQQAELRDPAEAERVRKERLRAALAEQARTRQIQAAQEAERRRDDALWQAEMARLGGVEKKKGAGSEAAKPRPPIILPAVQLKFEEGYWKAELSRVADTDTETLQTQKRTGLDKLAPPMKEEPPPGAAQPAVRKPEPRRDTAAESALFDEEMERLGGFELRREKDR